MIEIRDLTRYYGDRAALDNIRLDIDRREAVGFLGLNGAGKSTLLSILAGLLQPSSGRVSIDGIDALAQPRALRRRIGFLPDRPPLHPEMRVTEYLQWCGQLQGMAAAAVKASLERVVEVCQLAEVADDVIGTLSFGYGKRVGLARAIVHQPELVILDEPISGLDPRQIIEMRKVVGRLAEHATVILSSHILTEIEQTCDRMFVLHEGKLVADGRADELGANMTNAHLVQLSLRGSRDELRRRLDASDCVAEVQEVQPSADGETVHAVVRLAGERREQLVAELVGHGVGVRGLENVRSELEQVFINLTAKRRAERNVSTAGEQRA